MLVVPRPRSVSGQERVVFAVGIVENQRQPDPRYSFTPRKTRRIYRRMKCVMQMRTRVMLIVIVEQVAFPSHVMCPELRGPAKTQGTHMELCVWLLSMKGVRMPWESGRWDRIETQ